MCARSAVTSDAVINRRDGTPPSISSDPLIPSSGPTNPERIGTGVTSTSLLLSSKGHRPPLRIPRHHAAMSLFDYDTRPATPGVVLVDTGTSAAAYRIRDFLSRNSLPVRMGRRHGLGESARRARERRGRRTIAPDLRAPRWHSALPGNARAGCRRPRDGVGTLTLANTT